MSPCIIFVLFVLMPMARVLAAPASGPTTNPVTEGRLTLPSIGISIPVPHGWITDPERIGSIGMFSVSNWIKPAASGSNQSLAAITVVAVNPSLRREITPEVVLEPGPPVGGKPSLHLMHIPSAKTNHPDNWFARGYADGYRIEAHGFYFYVLHWSPNPSATAAIFHSVLSGIRWSKPIPAHQCLTLNGRRVPFGHNTGLSYEIPDPFWENPFRNLYSIESLAKDKDTVDANFQVEPIKGANDTPTALAAAAKMPLYYEQFDPTPQWRVMSLDPEIHISKMAQVGAGNGQKGSYVKLIVAKAPSGKYIRIALGVSGPRDVVEAYDHIMEALARTISTVPAPAVPRRELQENGK